MDDLDGPVLREFKPAFLRGAMIVAGHSVCARFAWFSYAGDEADAEYGNRSAKNAFFEAVGRLAPVTSGGGWSEGVGTGTRLEHHPGFGCIRALDSLEEGNHK